MCTVQVYAGRFCVENVFCNFFRIRPLLTHCGCIAFSEITDIGFHFGSVVGGSRLVLRGSNLDASLDDYPLEVYVGGMEIARHEDIKADILYRAYDLLT